MEGSKRATCWSITINNPEQSDYDATQNVSGWKEFVKFEGQNEKGENGTPHIQGMLITKSTKFSAVKKHFPRAHIEIAKSQSALAKYVTKEDTRESSIATVKVASVGNLNKAILEHYPPQTFGRGFGLTAEGAADDYVNGVMASCSEAAASKLEEGLEILDSLTRMLIRQGFYGIEYISANPSVRTTWKKYIRDILYREYASRPQAPSESPQEDDAKTETSSDYPQERDSVHEGDYNFRTTEA